MEMVKNKTNEQNTGSHLPNGRYETNNGSILEISGHHGGIVKIQFDWFEEGACIDCECQPYPELFANNDWRIVWCCDVCGGGNAKLHKVR